MPPTVIATSFPITCAANLRHDLGDDGVDLARHDRAALLELRQRELARPARGPEPRKRMSFAIFVSETATDFSAPDTSTMPSRAAVDSNGSAGGRMVSRSP